MNTVYSLFRNANVISVMVFSKLSETFNPSFAALRSKGGQSGERRAESESAAPITDPFFTLCSISSSFSSSFSFSFSFPPHHPAHGHLIHHFHHVFHLVELLYKRIDLGYVLS
jgi:hypothetical protein